MDNIAKQARQGNIPAILFVLNEQLSEVEVKTRAVFVDGVLQLLCEATQAEQLEKSTIVERVRDVLESVSPHNIYHVRINSRIMKKHQLLWLEDIHQNQGNQLLWSEDLILPKPPLIQKFIRDFQYYPSQIVPNSATEEHRQFQWSLLGGAGVSLVLLLVGWAVYNWLNARPTTQPMTQTTVVEPTVVEPTPEATFEAEETPPSDEEQFAQAVRLAEEAVAMGKEAQTAEEWFAIAEKWQEAAELMTAVSPEYPRYATAQNRAALYRRNGEVAQEEADKRTEF